MEFKTKIFLLATFILGSLVGCSKKEAKELNPLQGGPGRAQWHGNIYVRDDINKALKKMGFSDNFCAQQVTPYYGPHANRKMIEISVGYCPQGLVDDSSRRVFLFAYEANSASGYNRFEIRDLEYSERAGQAFTYHVKEFENRNISQIETFCNLNGDRDLCYVEERDGDLHIEMY